MKPVGCCLLSMVAVAALCIIPFGLHAYAAGPGDYPTSLTNADEAAVNEKPGKPNTDFISIYAGGDFVKNSNYGYVGATVALNGDLSRRGFLVQGIGGFGNYDYLNSGVPGGKVNADLTEASGLLGYQIFAGNVKFEAFGGVDWQNNDLSPPDPTNPVSGSETDFVTSANIETVDPRPFYFDLSGAYSIVNQSYWSKARIGYKFGTLGRVVIGPEGAFYGNENFNSERAGAFIKLPLGRKLSLEAAGGFNFVANQSFFQQVGGVISSGSFGGLGGTANGGYGSVSISRSF